MEKKKLKLPKDGLEELDNIFKNCSENTIVNMIKPALRLTKKDIEDSVTYLKLFVSDCVTGIRTNESFTSKDLAVIYQITNYEGSLVEDSIESSLYHYMDNNADYFKRHCRL